MTWEIRDPVHKTRVHKDGHLWFADCLTCPKGLQQHVTNWHAHMTWAGAMETALRHNSSNQWART